MLVEKRKDKEKGKEVAISVSTLRLNQRPPGTSRTLAPHVFPERLTAVRAYSPAKGPPVPVSWSPTPSLS